MDEVVEEHGVVVEEYIVVGDMDTTGLVKSPRLVGICSYECLG